MEISSKDKQKLKGLAHSIKPSVIIGKEGASKMSILLNKELEIISPPKDKDSMPAPR